ncbi:MAG: hypothetical protein J6S24_09825, partial [Lentisphaeria bacterium]|nr:hypothetical protein [Lentisphaeria bacterium]
LFKIVRILFACDKGIVSWGWGKLLFTGKEVFPFPKPQPFSRKAGYFFLRGVVSPIREKRDT